MDALRRARRPGAGRAGWRAGQRARRRMPRSRSWTCTPRASSRRRRRGARRPRRPTWPRSSGALGDGLVNGAKQELDRGPPIMVHMPAVKSLNTVPAWSVDQPMDALAVGPRGPCWPGRHGLAAPASAASHGPSRRPRPGGGGDPGRGELLPGVAGRARTPGQPRGERPAPQPPVHRRGRPVLRREADAVVGGLRCVHLRRHRPGSSPRHMRTSCSTWHTPRAGGSSTASPTLPLRCWPESASS